MKWLMRQLLQQIEVGGNKLFGAIGEVEEGIIMAIVVAGSGREETLGNITLSTPA